MGLQNFIFFVCRNVVKTLHLPPGQVALYTWQEPILQRDLVWQSKEYGIRSNDLQEVCSLCMPLSLQNTILQHFQATVVFV